MLASTLRRGIVKTLFGLCVLELCVSVQDVAAQSESLIEMPANVATRVSDGIRNYPSSGRNPQNLRQAAGRKNAAKSLEKLRKLRWPDYSKLTLVKIEDSNAVCPSKQIRVAWIGPANAETINLLTSESEFVALPAKRYRIEPFPFERFWKSERQQVLKEVDPDVEEIVSITVHPQGGITPRGQYDAVRFFNFVYLASWFEKNKDLTLVLDRELDAGAWGNDGPFFHAWQKLHTHRLQQGRNLLVTGAPLADVLDHWREIERLFGDAALPPLIQRLEQQIVGDGDVKDLDADAIAKLTSNEQVRYWIAHMPQDRGTRSYPIIVPNNRTQAAANALQKLGWHAVPQLIVALRDTRLTRTLFADSWEEAPQILPVQDLAWEILRGLIEEAVLFSSDGRMFSGRTPQVQSERIAKIEAWWKEHGQDSERSWWLSRLEQPRYGTRMLALTNLERLDPTSIDSVATLQAWIASAQQQELLSYCDQLRQRGFSGAIPKLDQWLTQQRQDGYQKVASSMLLRHGELQDFRFLQQCLRMKTPTQFPADYRARIWFDLTLGTIGQWQGTPQQVPRMNPLGIVLFVDLLDRDRLVGLPGRQSHNSITEFELAQQALAILQRVTGHESGSDGKATLPERKAAMDRWLGWWRESGRADFLRKHPQVAPLFEEVWHQGDAATINELSEMVDAEDPREFSRITYRIPRGSVSKLVAEGSLLVNSVPQFADRFRFATPAAAEKWFRSESPVPGQPLPCMIVPIADSIEADSKGRIWCRWDLFGYPPARFENGEWTTFAAQRAPDSWTMMTFPGNTGGTTSWEIVEPPRAGHGDAMLFPTTLTTECGFKSELRCDLVDAQGWLRFSVTDLPQHPSFDRILKAVPVGRIKQSEHSHFARDEAGRVVVSEGDWKIFENRKEVPKSARLRVPRTNYDTPRGLIGNGDVWIVSRHDADQSVMGKDHVVGLAVEQGEVVEKPLPLSPTVGPPRVWINAGPIDSANPAHARGRSVTAWDSNGNVVARHDGHLVGIDSRGGRWLAIGPRGAVESLQRIDVTGREQTWKNPNFRGPDIWAETLFELAFAPDGTAWLPIGQELVHLRSGDEALEEVERFPLPEPRWQRIHCDPSGDVWIVFQNSQESDKRPRLYRFATHSKRAAR